MAGALLHSTKKRAEVKFTAQCISMSEYSRVTTLVVKGFVADARRQPARQALGPQEEVSLHFTSNILKMT